MSRYRLYTQPTRVQHVAEILRQHPTTYSNVFEGTEHVYFECNLSGPGTYNQMKHDGVTGQIYPDLVDLRSLHR